MFRIPNSFGHLFEGTVMVCGCFYHQNGSVREVLSEIRAESPRIGSNVDDGLGMEVTKTTGNVGDKIIMACIDYNQQNKN